MKNRVQLIGHVGADPEVKTTSSNKKVANVRLATSDYYYNDAGEKIEQTEWHRLTVWGKLAETIEKYVKKGKEMAVEGKLVHRSFEDKEGQKRTVSEIVVEDFVLLGGKP